MLVLVQVRSKGDVLHVEQEAIGMLHCALILEQVHCTGADQQLQNIYCPNSITLRKRREFTSGPVH